MADSQKDAQTRSLRVVWQEGMLLSPQHFQQMERAEHRRVSQRFRFAESFGWGLSELEIDEQALAHGRLALTRAAGVFPDGTSFDTAEGDPLPAPRDLTSWFEGQRDRLEVHIGLPVPRPGQPLTAREAGNAIPGPRYTSSLEAVADENAEGIDRELVLARKNIVLLFPDEALSQHERLRVGEIVRSTTGFSVRDAFGGVADPYVPPVVSLRGSRSLLSLVGRMLNLLLDRSRELSEMRTQRGGFAEFGKSDAASFWMLHSVNTYIPILTHHVQNPGVHPEQVFLVLASLCGELCTFSANRTPRDLPVYEHEALGSCYGQLTRLLEELLKTQINVRGARVDLVRKPGSVHVGGIADPRLLDARGKLFLGVCIEGPDRPQILLTFPKRAKIASESKVQSLIVAATEGLALHPPAPVPAGVPCFAGYDYFELDRSHPLWEDVRRANQVAVYLPRELEQVKLDLVGTWE